MDEDMEVDALDFDNLDEVCVDLRAVKISDAKGKEGTPGRPEGDSVASGTLRQSTGTPFSTNPNNSAGAESKSGTNNTSKPSAEGNDGDDDCVICLDTITNPKELHKCSHKFCTDCIDRSFKNRPVCPVCFVPYGIITGNQPEGYMHHNVIKRSLSGYSGIGTIVIYYSFCDGMQTMVVKQHARLNGLISYVNRSPENNKETKATIYENQLYRNRQTVTKSSMATQRAEHPHPGQQYWGTDRTAYLPDDDEGRKVLRLLKVAFERRLVFTVGRSRTTGRDNVVTWNDIHHKTNMHGGPQEFGYPDPTYLSRIQEELASVGVTEESFKSENT